MNKTLRVWGGVGLNDIEEIVNRNKEITHVYYECVSEINFNRALTGFNFFDKLAETCNLYNIPITVFLSTSIEFNSLNFNYTDKYQNITFVHWPTYWFARTLYLMLKSPDYDYNCEKVNYDIKDNDSNLVGKKVNYLYSNYNNYPKLHRIKTMDTLAKYNLIDRGYISWRDLQRVSEEAIANKPKDMLTSYFFHQNYYKHWTPKILIIDQPLDVKFNQEILPPMYTNVFTEIVTESDDEFFFISEKTVKPLLTNQLFLVVSNQYFHRNLTKLGFKLYDELFDYSFDNESDLDNRIEGIVKNIDKYKNYSNEHLAELNKSVEFKLRHNRKLALDYSVKLIPDYIKSFCTTHNINLEHPIDINIIFEILEGL